MEKKIIKNRKNKRIVVLIEEAKNPKGFAIVMHGLGGFKEQRHIEAFAQAFKDKGFSVVRFDTTNTFGESDGRYEEATTTNYYEDLGDVISWAKSQNFFITPFYLVGHSLGGISIILYTQKHPEEVKGLAPISTVVSGKLSAETHKAEQAEWRRTGWREEISESKKGIIKRLPWSHMEDRLKYDALVEDSKLTMPVLLIVGDEDNRTPVSHQKLLYEKLPGQKELHVIEGADHNFRGESYDKNLNELKKILSKWIDQTQRA